VYNKKVSASCYRNKLEHGHVATSFIRFHDISADMEGLGREAQGVMNGKSPQKLECVENKNRGNSPPVWLSKRGLPSHPRGIRASASNVFAGSEEITERLSLRGRVRVSIAFAVTLPIKSIAAVTVRPIQRWKYPIRLAPNVRIGPCERTLAAGTVLIIGELH